jgi:hypothetical protein
VRTWGWTKFGVVEKIEKEMFLNHPNSMASVLRTSSFVSLLNEVMEDIVSFFFVRETDGISHSRTGQQQREVKEKEGEDEKRMCFGIQRHCCNCCGDLTPSTAMSNGERKEKKKRR